MSEETKRCFECGEEILVAARKCKHCGSAQDNDESSKSASASMTKRMLIPLWLAAGLLLVIALVMGAVIWHYYELRNRIEQVQALEKLKETVENMNRAGPAAEVQPAPKAHSSETTAIKPKADIKLSLTLPPPEATNFGSTVDWFMVQCKSQLSARGVSKEQLVAACIDSAITFATCRLNQESQITECMMESTTGRE